MDKVMSFLYDLSIGVTEQVSSTPRVRIILRNSTQWRTWFAQVETIAKNLDIWNYINPNVSEDDRPPLPERPTRPSKDDKKYDRDAKGRLTTESQLDYNNDRKDYDDDLSEYKTIKLVLDKVSERIRNTLAVEIQNLTVEVRDTSKLLATL